MIEEAISMLCKCEPLGVINEGVNEEHECKDCYGCGTNEDLDLAFYATDEAKSNIVDSCNVDSFKELFKIYI